MWVSSLGWEDPMEEEMATTPVFLPGKSHRQSSLVDYSPRGHKESDMTELLSTQKGECCLLLFCKFYQATHFIIIFRLTCCLYLCEIL